MKETIMAIMGDEDTVTGFLLSGIGDISDSKGSNFLIVSDKTSHSEISSTFEKWTVRSDISIILITQDVAEQIRYKLDDYEQQIPSVLEIPSKNETYDPSKDTIMKKVSRFFGNV